MLLTKQKEGQLRLEESTFTIQVSLQKNLKSKLLQSIKFGYFFHSVIYAIKLHVKYTNKEYFNIYRQNSEQE